MFTLTTVHGTASFKTLAKAALVAKALGLACTIRQGGEIVALYTFN